MRFPIRYAVLVCAARFDVAALNFRGCSGELGKYPLGYHLGFTDDLLHVVGAVRSLTEAFLERPRPTRHVKERLLLLSGARKYMTLGFDGMGIGADTR